MARQKTAPLDTLHSTRSHTPTPNAAHLHTRCTSRYYAHSSTQTHIAADAFGRNANQIIQTTTQTRTVARLTYTNSDIQFKTKYKTTDAFGRNANNDIHARLTRHKTNTAETLL